MASFPDHSLRTNLYPFIGHLKAHGHRRWVDLAGIKHCLLLTLQRNITRWCVNRIWCTGVIHQWTWSNSSNFCHDLDGNPCTLTLNLSAIGSILTESDYGYIQFPIGILICTHCCKSLHCLQDKQGFFVCQAENSTISKLSLMLLLWHLWKAKYSLVTVKMIVLAVNTMNPITWYNFQQNEKKLSKQNHTFQKT